MKQKIGNEEQIKRIDTYKLVLTALFIALGVILPQVFHILGAVSGATFLPMHIPVIVAGLILGPWYGMIVGLVVPICSSLYFGMPAIPYLYFMLIELMAYGLLSGLTIKRLPIYPSLILTMIMGRIAYGAGLTVGIYLLGVNYPFANMAAFLGGIATGFPGIIIQLVSVPGLYYLCKKIAYSYTK